MRNDYHHLRPGLIAKIEYSIGVMRKAERLARRYDPDNGFYLAFSGGKDSQTLYHLAQLAGVPFHAEFSPTSVDPPQVIRFIRTHYPDVSFRRLTTSIYDETLRKGMLPTMIVRWCCQVFKENAGAGKVKLIGVRREESTKRSRRNVVEVTGHKFSGDFDGFADWQVKQIKKAHKNLNHDEFDYDKESEVKCVNGKDSILILPILHWTARDVWDFLNGMDIEHCELYDKGHTRIGCILCPMSQRKAKLRDIKEFPHVKEKWIQTIMRLRALKLGGITERRRDGLPTINLWNDAQFQPPPNARGVAAAQPFSDGHGGTPAPDHGEITEREIAENIFDWWTSGKKYSEWYADKFLQQRINFDQQ